MQSSKLSGSSSSEGMNRISRSRKSSNSGSTGESRIDHGFPKFRDWSQDRPKGPQSRSTSLTRQSSRNSTLSTQSSVASSTNFNIKAGMTTSTRPTPRTVKDTKAKLNHTKAVQFLKKEKITFVIFICWIFSLSKSKVSYCDSDDSRLRLFEEHLRKHSYTKNKHALCHVCEHILEGTFVKGTCHWLIAK